MRNPALIDTSVATAMTVGVPEIAANHLRFHTRTLLKQRRCDDLAAGWVDFVERHSSRVHVVGPSKQKIMLNSISNKVLDTHLSFHLLLEVNSRLPSA